ncbi:hypothetical protein HPB47_008439 [Ixodes persulcatus]|uniref:Uncharacterized protein n=1 Tax=Ixodes persulcatus TaxID=34615 RepID=A0AC60P4T4_IXOPE|nr:hypothetical protein HPB47_008439 [Ixodes persulcatus]
MTHLAFRRDVAMSLLHLKQKLVLRPGPRVHPSIAERKTDATEDRRILEATQGDPFRAARNIGDALQPEIRYTDVRRLLYDASLHSSVACQSPLLTERHKQLQLDFAHFLENRIVEDWTHVIFSDDCTFFTRLGQQRRVWRPDNFRIDARLPSEVFSDIIDHVLMSYILDGSFPDESCGQAPAWNPFAQLFAQPSALSTTEPAAESA